MPKYPKVDGRLNLCGEIFREARLQQHLSCEELARRMRDYRIPMSRTAIYRIEKGTRRVLLDEVAILTRILQLDPNAVQDSVVQRLEMAQRKKKNME